MPSAAPPGSKNPPDEEAPEADAQLPGSDVARPGTEVAIRHSDAPVALVDMITLAEKLADSDVLPAHLRRKPANVLALMFASRAMDIPMWTAFQVLHNVEGKIAMDATFQRALVIRAGYRFRVVERSMDRAVVEIIRPDDPRPQTSEFTWAEAQAAGLDKKNTWTKYRKAMLVARATTQAIRDICPEVLFGPSYSPEELDVTLDDNGQPITVVASERVGADVKVRTAEEREALRTAYAQRIGEADSTEELNLIWADARTDNVLDAPLDEQHTVKQAMQARAAEIKAARAAEDKLRAAGFAPAPEPATESPDVVDAEVVAEHTPDGDPWDTPAQQTEMPL